MADHRATELECEQTIIQTAKMFGWLVHGERAAWSARGWNTPIKGHVGWPDLVMVRPPTILVVELKRHPNVANPQQLKWLEAFRACGVDAEVIYVPDELDALLAVLATKPAV